MSLLFAVVAYREFRPNMHNQMTDVVVVCKSIRWFHDSCIILSNQCLHTILRLMLL